MFARVSLMMTVTCLLLACGESQSPFASATGRPEPETLSCLESFRDSSLAAAVSVAIRALQPEADSLALLALSELNTRGQGITDLAGIERLANLRVLVLGDNRISDLRPLSGLHHLRQLDLENNRVVKVTPLVGLDSLIALILDYNQVMDPTPLLQLPSLQSLSLRGNPIPSVQRAAFVSVLATRDVWVDATVSDTSHAEDAPASGERLALLNGNTLYLAVPDTGTPMLLLRVPDGLISDPAWSRDGSRLAIAVTSNRRSDLCYIDGVRSQVVRITNNRKTMSSPAWSPDGQQLAFVSGRDGNLEIYAIATEGGGWCRLTDNPACDENPDWSPDGQWLAFSSDREGQSGIFLMRPDGSDVRRLETGLGEAREPAWSPDGTWITFLRTNGWNQDLCIIRPSGSDEHLLRSGKGWKEDPCWTPAGLVACLVDQRPCVVSVTGTGHQLSLYSNGLAWSPASVYGFDQEVHESVVFADAALERVAREALGIEGAISAMEAASLVDLSAQARGVVSLSGVESLYRLSRLDLGNAVRYVDDGQGGERPDTAGQTLSYNRVADLSPVASLTELTELNISLNPVSDLSPLAGLANLSRLCIDDCPVNDLAQLGKLWHLGSLTLRHLQVSDLSPLSGLAQLWDLQVNWTQVEDVSPLAGLRRLVRLDLAHNRIIDIGPLVSTAATEVWLTGNPLSEESRTVHVPAMRARGVTVHL